MNQPTLDDFVDDRPWGEAPPPLEPISIADAIEGVGLFRLQRHADARGHLTVLMSEPEGLPQPIVHIYQVLAAPGSVRAWVYHKRQWDRLAFTAGDFRIVLYDLRPGSPTLGKLNVIDAGETNPCRLHIPPFVVHGVQNRGAEPSCFVNMPTRAYDPAEPDKSRLPVDHPGIPYRFS
jgi:dTDP-4-dehydrorhamnose 3,5-epimerase